MDMKMKEGRSWSPRGTRRRGLKSFTSRFAVRFLAIAAIVGTYHCVELHVRYRDAMRAKYSPTHFTLSDYDQATLFSSGWEVDSHFANPDRMALLQNFEQWKKLGGGREGDAYAFNNSVIKVYNEASTPFRNCMPEEDKCSRRWPTEIPATLIAGGHQDGSTPPNDGLFTDRFVQVKDYFLATTDPTKPPKWHLVTPFLRSGTLKTLAKKLRTSENPLSYKEVDRKFRPSFESLLSALDDLHMNHNLCHDDVKMDNIFIASEDDPRQWKMADLGNAREPEHPYHFSALWTADTPQLSDCRANDALRLTKTYVEFVRAASGNPQDFDDEFFRGLLPLTRLYWNVAGAAKFGYAASAAEMRSQSKIYPPVVIEAEALWMAMEPSEVTASRGWNPMFKAILGWGWSLRAAVTMELRVGAKEDLGKLFGLTWITGIPVTSCHAA